MPDDGTAETSMGFPEPVSRDFAFDDAFFEIDSADGDIKPTAPEEETELAYDYGMFGAAKHSAAVYRPKQKETPPPPAEPVPAPPAAEPAAEIAGPDPFAELFDSINAELSQIETAESNLPQQEDLPQDKEPQEELPRDEAPQAEPPQEEPPQPSKGKNTFTYDEFRARFTPEDDESAPETEPGEKDFSLHADVELNDEDGLEEDLIPSEEEPEEMLVSAAAMNIRLDTEDDEEHELVQQNPAHEEEETGFESFDLRETAKEQVAEYFEEGEEPPELVAPYSPPKGNFFTRNIIPVRGDSAPEVIRKIVMIIALLAVFGSAGYLINDYVITPYRTANQIDQLSELIDEENTNVIEELDSLQKEYPGVEFPEGMMEKYASLYARNKDFVGWLSIDALDISLPVVQGENNEQYLKTDFDGKKNKYGSLFVNAYNDMKNLDMNTTIFGHNMKDSKMLGNLVYYRTPKGYQKAPVIEFNTLYRNYKWKVFAVILTNGEKEGDRGYLFNYMFANLSSQDVLEDYLGEIKQRSLYYPEVDIALTDKFLTISTCVYDFDEARLIILARMVRPGESTAVSGKVYGNDNPRFPQAYYDKLKLNNPYADAERWQPS
ncbi:MAG: sortase [Clostridia bacterium]|nr:sortase [Clostridia bacterium]